MKNLPAGRPKKIPWRRAQHPTQLWYSCLENSMEKSGISWDLSDEAHRQIYSYVLSSVTPYMWTLKGLNAPMKMTGFQGQTGFHSATTYLHTWQRNPLDCFIQVPPPQKKKLAHSGVSWGYIRTPLWRRIQMKRSRCLERACAVLVGICSVWHAVANTLVVPFILCLNGKAILTFSLDRSCWSRF